ncbi:hypothetical protein [Haloferula sp. A504]|uniref:hypothetical protein n=1 Tax=Haloferula sp. A504 TaxID=3373601 RepID=UPI0031C0ABE9|nr:hypothetical protein [Verrucomicrobiaceae bacterium E54]
MKTPAILASILFCLLQHLSSAEEKHILEEGLLPATKELWSILSIGVPDEDLRKLPPPEEFVRKTIPALKKMGHFPDKIRAKIEANQSIRSAEEIEAQIEKFPDDDDGKKRKERLRRWFSDKNRPEVEKEAMFYLLQFVIPNN